MALKPNSGIRALAAAAGLAMLAFAMLASAGQAADGVFRIVDGNTVLIGGKSHTLYGIEAPSPGETCKLRGAMRDCGLIARASLMDLTAGARVICQEVAETSSSPRHRCRANGYDLSEGMVHTGWARALRDGPPRFKRIMVEARAGKRGMWHR